MSSQQAETVGNKSQPAVDHSRGVSMETTSVKKSIVVNVPIAHAFDVFTKRFDLWWPKAHHIGKAEMKEAILEGREGGRWYEKGVDGSECDWGEVLVWNPSSHVAVSWRLDGTWTLETDPTHASRIDVRFYEEGGGGGGTKTRVELEHSQLDRHAHWEKLKEGIAGQGGWSGLLEMFAAKATELAAI